MALAIVDVAHKDVGTKVQVDVRGRMVEAKSLNYHFIKEVNKEKINL